MQNIWNVSLRSWKRREMEMRILADSVTDWRISEKL